MGGRSGMKRNAVILLRRVSKEFGIRKRAWEKVRREFSPYKKVPGMRWKAIDILDKMTKILKAERRKR